MTKNCFQFVRLGGLLCGVCLLLTGCATPEYLMPRGYSSTYQKALNKEAMRQFQAAPIPVEVLTHADEHTAILR